MAMLSKLRANFLLKNQTSQYHTNSLFFTMRNRQQNPKPKQTEFKIPKKGSQEYQQMLQQQKGEKKEAAQKKIFENLTPRFVSAMIFSAAIPQSVMLYRMIWSDPCSDIFFHAFEQSFMWIACLNALEGAAACGLGYIDYRTIVAKDPKLQYDMRKKRLAFAKFAFIMAIAGLILVETPTPNCVFPLIVGSVWNSIKLGTQISYNLTPDKFFTARTFLSMYNLGFLLLIWYKLRQARKDKLDLEFAFYNRVEGIMLRMSNLFDDEQFKEVQSLQLDI
eukprot:403375849